MGLELESTPDRNVCWSMVFVNGKSWAMVLLVAEQGFEYNGSFLLNGSLGGPRKKRAISKSAQHLPRGSFFRGKNLTL